VDAIKKRYVLTSLLHIAATAAAGNCGESIKICRDFLSVQYSNFFHVVSIGYHVERLGSLLLLECC
jgi:hypothetical protein